MGAVASDTPGERVLPTACSYGIAMTQQTESNINRGGAATDDSETAPTVAESDASEGDLSSDGGGGSATADADESSAESSLPLDQTFEILKNQRRRYVLRYLDSADESVSLSDLAEQIAAWENDKEIREITSSERKRVYVGLYQCHLPKMAGMDVIRFNKPRGIIEPGEHIDVFNQYLQSNDSPAELSLNSRQLALSILGIGLVPVAVLFVAQGALPMLVTVSSVLLLTAGSVIHLRRRDAPPRVSSDKTAA